MQKSFYKEYMYSMTVFSLMGFCLMQFPLEIIDERNNGWYKKIISTPITVLNYYLAKILKTMTLFLFQLYFYIVWPISIKVYHLNQVNGSYLV